jgi:hypothetical protein
LKNPGRKLFDEVFINERMLMYTSSAGRTKVMPILTTRTARDNSLIWHTGFTTNFGSLSHRNFLVTPFVTNYKEIENICKRKKIIFRDYSPPLHEKRLCSRQKSNSKDSFSF